MATNDDFLIVKVPKVPICHDLERTNFVQLAIPKLSNWPQFWITNVSFGGVVMDVFINDKNSRPPTHILLKKQQIC